LIARGAVVKLLGMWRWLTLTLALSARTVRHPSIAVDLARVAWRFRRRQWYRRFPFLPLPDAAYLRWRMYTAYGDPRAVPPAEDLERYAHWATRKD
jgi:hypothetical protein